MEVITKIITLEDVTKPLNIIPLGDVHYGNINCDLKKFKETIEYIKNKENCYTILMGDMCDAILTSDKRFDMESISPELRGSINNLAMAQYQTIRDLLVPIKEKILVGIRGNHGETLRLNHGVDFDAWLYGELGIPMGGYTSFLVIKLDRKQFHTENLTFFLHHGFMASRKTGAKVNAIEALSGDFDADIYLLGHSHDLFVLSKNKIEVAGTHIKEKRQFFAHTGTFMKSYTECSMNYGEKSCYPPLKTGVVKFILVPKNGRIDIHASE